MKALFGYRGLLGISACISFLNQGALGQVTGTYTDPTTGIVLSTYTFDATTTTGGFTWGWALPPDAGTVAATEYIGLLIGSTPDGAGWSGISHGGTMTSSLLLTAWANEDEVLPSFRFASGYTEPEIYAGDATITPIVTEVNEANYTIIYRCQGCWSWDHAGVTGSRSTTEGPISIGWVQGLDPATDPADAESAITQHDNGLGILQAAVADAVNEQYSEWVDSIPGPTGTATETPTTTPTATATPTFTGQPVPTGAFDYIVVGGGAGGIPVADRLSEDGNSVLLIEKGPPSTHRWGGRRGPKWVKDGDLTRFDVPGLCNQIWFDSKGIACTDVDMMAGCVLGGGTAVNAGLWWNPPAIDWDENFPEGWKSEDMAGPAEKLFERIPGTYTPSMDGEIYLPQGYKMVSNALSAAGWDSVVANDEPNLKSDVYTETPYMFSGGERGGPLATYLVSANKRDNFNLWMNTSVRRVIRSGGHITGVEVEATAEGGYTGVVNVTESTGRVILSAGTFGSPKILMRSGIGPQDSLEIVSESKLDGESMIAAEEWINLPVGKNLVDHTNTDIIVAHPDVVFYDFYESWYNPNPDDRDAYLDDRVGILAQAAPNIGPVFFQEIEGSDGITRQFQYTARVEGEIGPPDNTSMTISQYLGRGSTSRGRVNITPALTMTVSQNPHIQDEADIDAVIQGISSMLEVFAAVPNITFVRPTKNITAAAYVNGLVSTAAGRTANHWLGSSKIGPDDGREDGTAVVDLDTKVYGTDNLFVVDGGLFPGMVTANPSAYIMTVAERAVARIKALAAS